MVICFSIFHKVFELYFVCANIPVFCRFDTYNTSNKCTSLIEIFKWKVLFLFQFFLASSHQQQKKITTTVQWWFQKQELGTLLVHILINNSINIITEIYIFINKYKTKILCYETIIWRIRKNRCQERKWRENK